jgi:hypothetical protein
MGKDRPHSTQLLKIALIIQQEFQKPLMNQGKPNIINQPKELAYSKNKCIFLPPFSSIGKYKFVEKEIQKERHHNKRLTCTYLILLTKQWNID